jgi:hypothetical protein
LRSGSDANVFRAASAIVSAAFCIIVCGASGATAQSLRGAHGDAFASSPLRPALPSVHEAGRGPQKTLGDAAFLASLAVPGSGQYLLKQQRWLPYAALEAWAWLRYLDRRSTARKLSVRYRDFAWDVARRVSTGERRDTTFPYYEILIHTTSSGAFDAQPGTPGVQPESDTETYNGQQWELARSAFVPAGSSGDPGSPGYDAALTYYMSRAIPDEFAFAWNTGRFEQQEYAKVISDSDAAYRDATRLLGVILANHLTSAVDALISSRLRSTGTNLRFDSGLSPDRAAPSGQMRVRFDAQLHLSW